MHPTRYMVQVTHDDGKTWEPLPEVTIQPISRHWLTLYVSEGSLLADSVASYHGTRRYLTTDADAFSAALHDECEWRNSQEAKMDGKTARYRVITKG